MSFFALRMKSCLILVLLLMASTATSAADDGGSLLLTISSGTMPIESLAFSPDGLQIVAPYDTTGARVYSTETGDMIHHLTHTTDVKAVAFSKDGKLIATVDTTFHTKFWDAETGMQVQTFLGTYLPMKIVFSPAGNHLAMVTPTGVQIYDINTGTQIYTAGALAHDAAYLVDKSVPAVTSTRLLVTSTTGIDMYDADSTYTMIQNFAPLTGADTEARALAVHPDGTHVAAAFSGASGASFTIKVYEVAAVPMLVKTLHGHTMTVGSLAFSPFGGQLVSTTGYMEAKVWEFPSGLLVRSLDNTMDHKTVDFSASGLIATSDMTGNVHLYSAFTGCRPQGPGRMVRFKCSKQNFIDNFGCVEDSCGNLQCPPELKEADARALCSNHQVQYEQQQGN